MSSTKINKFLYGSLGLAACAALYLAIIVQAQYNSFNSESNSDSDGSPILTSAELGKLVRNSARAQANHRNQNQQYAAATKNLYNRQQPMQYAPTQHRRNYGSSELNGFGPMMGASNGRGASANSDSENDEDGSNSFGPNFGANFDSNDNENEGSGANDQGQSMNLDKAASGYPGQGDFSGDSGSGFNFDGQSGYGPSADGSDFGPSEGFGNEGRRAKSASSLMGSRNFGTEDAGAPQFGPNSAVNSGERDIDEDGRAGYAPEGQNDNDGDNDE